MQKESGSAQKSHRARGFVSAVLSVGFATILHQINEHDLTQKRVCTSVKNSTAQSQIMRHTVPIHTHRPRSGFRIS